MLCHRQEATQQAAVPECPQAVLELVATVLEQARLTKQREQLLERIAVSQHKLANAAFLSKASPEVVQKERERLAECETQLENVQAYLVALA